MLLRLSTLFATIVTSVTLAALPETARAGNKDPQAVCRAGGILLYPGHVERQNVYYRVWIWDYHNPGWKLLADWRPMTYSPPGMTTVDIGGPGIENVFTARRGAFFALWTEMAAWTGNQWANSNGWTPILNQGKLGYGWIDLDSGTGWWCKT